MIRKRSYSLLVLMGLLGLSCAVQAPDRQSSTDLSAHGQHPAVRDTVPVCVLERGDLRLVHRASVGMSDTAYSPAAPPFADKKEWYGRHEAIPYRGTRFLQYGLPVMRSPFQIRRIGEYDGIAVYADTDAVRNLENPGVLLVPISPGCEYQPYNYLNDSGQ